MSGERQTLKHQTQPTGGTFTMSVSIPVKYRWHVRLWRWMRRQPTSYTITRTTEPLPYNATAEEMQAAFEKINPSLRGAVRIIRR